MNQEKATAVAKEIFKSYPDAKELFVTSDEQVFFVKGNAETHAHGTLKDDVVVEVKRDALTIEHTVTNEDITENPELIDAGVKVGDEIEIPVNDDEGFLTTKETGEQKVVDNAPKKGAKKKANG